MTHEHRDGHFPKAKQGTLALVFFFFFFAFLLSLFVTPQPPPTNTMPRIPPDKLIRPNRTPEGVAPWNFQETSLKRQARMIEHCPDLERLTWAYGQNYESDSDVILPLTKMSLLAGLMRTRRHCPKLEAIIIPDENFAVQDFEVLLNSVTCLSELNLSFTNFGLDCWTVLKEHGHHGTTLRCLKLSGCSHLDSGGH